MTDIDIIIIIIIDICRQWCFPPSGFAATAGGRPSEPVPFDDSSDVFICVCVCVCVGVSVCRCGCGCRCVCVCDLAESAAESDEGLRWPSPV